MATFGHLVVGIAAGRLVSEEDGGRKESRRRMLLFAALSSLPDVDGLLSRFDLRGAPILYHRGVTHSFAFALVVGLATTLFWTRHRLPSPRLFLLATAVVASHGLLDMAASAGTGVAAFWPLTEKRYFLPWRFLEVAPIDLRFTTREGWLCLAREALLFLPLFVYALLPLRPPPATGDVVTGGR